MEYISGNIFIRQMCFEKAGYVHEGHSHTFDHTFFPYVGEFELERLREDGTVENTIVVKAAQPFNWVLIKAGVRHRIKALTDGAIGHCIFAHRNPQGEITQVYEGWHEATC